MIDRAGVSRLVLFQAFSLIYSELFGALAERDEQKQENSIRTYTYTIFLIGVGGALFQMISSLTLAKAGEELTMRMRTISFRSMLRQEISWFDLDENNLGALVTRLSTDAASLKGFTGPTLAAIFNAIGALIVALIVSFTAGWKLTLVMLAFTPLMIFTGVIQNQQLTGGKEKGSSSDAENGGKVRAICRRTARRTFVSFVGLACHTSHREYSHSGVSASRRAFHSIV